MDFSLNYLKTVVRIINNEQPMKKTDFQNCAVRWVNPDHKNIDNNVYEVLWLLYSNELVT